MTSPSSHGMAFTGPAGVRSTARHGTSAGPASLVTAARAFQAPPASERRLLWLAAATVPAASGLTAAALCRRASSGRNRGLRKKAATWRVAVRAAEEGGSGQTFSRAFPFSAVVGQEEIKIALLLNLVDPAIGGVMITGERGTGKSTAVRGLVRLLPDIDVVDGDRYNSHPTDVNLMSNEVLERIEAGAELRIVQRRTPFVELPLGATEDRVTGTIDIERALKEAGKAFEPGILASVNRGILYIDECNLLDDQLVDVLLDSAAGGVNTVEREGVSVRHPARFVLIGTSHPDEGDLRPQLLDRFGLTCSIRTAMGADWRLQVLTRSYDWSKKPEQLEAQFGPQDEALKALVLEARERLKEVKVSHELAVKISTICSRLNVDGLRGDIVTNRAARALCALQGRTEVTAEDIRRVTVLCLQHRLRKDVVSDSVDNSGRVIQALQQEFGEGPPPALTVAELAVPMPA